MIQRSLKRLISSTKAIILAMTTLGVAALAVILFVRTGLLRGILLGAIATTTTAITLALIVRTQRTAERILARTSRQQRSLQETGYRLNATNNRIDAFLPEIKKTVNNTSATVANIAPKSSPLAVTTVRLSEPKHLPMEAPHGGQPALIEVAQTAKQRLDYLSEQRTPYRINEALDDDHRVELPDSGWTKIIRTGEATQVEIDLSLSFSDNKKEAKAALLAVRAYYSDGTECSDAILRQHNEKYGSWTYLGTNVPQPQRFRFMLRADVVELRVSLLPWLDHHPRFRNGVGITLGYVAEVLQDHASPRNIRVAAILDDFSYESFRYECNLIRLHPDSWKDQLLEHRPDLFLCESAWSGGVSQGDPWKGKIYASERFPRENRNVLLQILAFCKEEGIKTAFWNKEDPSHYSDRAHDFVATALLFDHIFTTDAECVDRYKADYSHPSVSLLPFAVQPRLFNPVVRQERTNSVIFAGAWYENHAKRCEDMRTMFDAVIRSQYQLEIFDRFMGSGDAWHAFPASYAQYLHAPVPHNETAVLFKSALIGMTINTVTESETMFARRIFELMATNTFVVSNYSKGIDLEFGDDVLFLDREPGKLEKITPKAIETARARNLRKVLTEHTYAERLKTILDVCQVPYQQLSNQTGTVWLVHNEDEAQNALEKSLALSSEVYSDAVLLVSRDASSTTSSIIFEKFNGPQVTVVEQRLLDDGTIVPSSLSSCERLLFITDLDSLPAIDEVKHMRLHSTYTEFPIVLAQVDDQQYSLVEMHEFRTALVTPTMLSRLGRTSKIHPLMAYAV